MFFKDPGLWTWAAVVDHREVIFQKEMMVPHYIFGKVSKTCVNNFSQIHSTIAYGGQVSKGENRGAGGSKREAIEWKNGKITPVLCFINNKTPTLETALCWGPQKSLVHFLFPHFSGSCISK